jgi:hypothetical protein
MFVDLGINMQVTCSLRFGPREYRICSATSGETAATLQAWMAWQSWWHGVGGGNSRVESRESRVEGQNVGELNFLVYQKICPPKTFSRFSSISRDLYCRCQDLNFDFVTFFTENTGPIVSLKSQTESLSFRSPLNTLDSNKTKWNRNWFPDCALWP